MVYKPVQLTKTLKRSLLEYEMAEFVRLRNKNEAVGSPGQETWRNPLLREEGQPVGMTSPYHSLTKSQDRQLTFTKAFSDRLSGSFS